MDAITGDIPVNGWLICKNQVRYFGIQPRKTGTRNKSENQ